MEPKNRITEIDFTRGVAVIFMIICHIGIFGIILLNNLKKNSVNTNKHSKIFDIVGTIAHTLFIILVGINMVTSLKRTENRVEKEKVAGEFAKKNVKRALFIFLLGIMMSVIVKSVFGKWYIFFGIFQFIAVSIVLAIPFTLYYNSLTNIIMVIFLLITANIKSKNPVLNFFTGSINTKFLDYFPIIPYFAYVLIGITIGKLLKNIRSPDNLKKYKNKPVVEEIVYLGRNSINIYFTHLIIIFLILKISLWNKQIKIH